MATLTSSSVSTTIEINGDAWHGTDLAFDCGRPMKVYRLFDPRKVCNCLLLTVPNLQTFNLRRIVAQLASFLYGTSRYDICFRGGAGHGKVDVAIEVG